MNATAIAVAAVLGIAVALVVVLLVFEARAIRRANRSGRASETLRAREVGEAAQERQQAAHDRARGGMVDRARDRLPGDDPNRRG